MHPTTMYGVTKVAGELLENYYHDKYDVEREKHDQCHKNQKELFYNGTYTSSCFIIHLSHPFPC